MLHGTENRDILIVEKRNDTVYAVKIVVWTESAHERSKNATFFRNISSFLEYDEPTLAANVEKVKKVKLTD